MTKYYKSFLNLSTLFWLLFVLVTALIIWSTIFELNKSVVATGEVSPEGRPVKVQNRSQGAISDVFISVGDNVDMNTVLLSINTSKERQKLKYLKESQRAAHFEMARLSSVLGRPGGLESITPSEDPYYTIQKHIMESEKSVILGKIASLRSQIEAKTINLTLLLSRRPITEERLTLSQAKLNLVKEMEQMGYEGTINVLTMEAEYNDALDKIVTLQNEIELRQNEIRQLELEISSLNSERVAKASVEYYEVSKELAKIASEINEIELFLDDSAISAPVSGQVSRLLYENIGQFIDAGTTLAEIIPSTTKNVFYVEIPIASISEVSIGQKGEISLSNMDSRKVQTLSGVLTQLDGDVTVTEDGNKYYSAIVKFDDPSSDYLVPGVAGTISLQLGKRSVFTYIFDPILDVVTNSLKE